jgi:phosphoribosylanthranilate isomerase
MISVKICGITSIPDAEKAIDLGASAIGLIFYEKSPRCISIEDAQKITTSIKGKVPVVGVFVNEDIDRLQSILSSVAIDIVQLHGDENPQYCQQLNHPIIKVFRVDSQFDKTLLKAYNVNAFLFDTYKKGLPGGTGDTFNWKLLKHIQINRPIILSGGLKIDNVLNAVDLVQPAAIDVNSGVENCPGEKSDEKLNALFDLIGKAEDSKNLFKTMMKDQNV